MIENKIKRIEVKNIFKSFDLDLKREKSFLYHLINIFSYVRDKDNIDVINNISFDVYDGEIIGIIGKNGTGKSTLLRLIAGIYQIDRGSIKLKGLPVYINGLGQGSSPKLTMRENIFLLGSIMGLGRKDIRNKFNEIVQFSGLKDFLDVRMYQFSTGMVSRLNFSIFIHCLKYRSPEILLFDEVLSTNGDIDFQEKALKKMEELIRGGASVLMVSHNLETLKKYCKKILWLKNDKTFEIGDSENIIDLYKKSKL